MNDAFSVPRKPLYTRADLPDVPWLDARPGEFPFVRGIHATMYAQRPWTIRQYAGYADASATNLAYRRAIESGARGLSVAFDLPTHRGHDSDDESIGGDVGMAGVAIDSVEDMKRLFEGIALDEVSVSMTMSGAVLPVLAAFIVAAEESGVAAERLRGTIQNDILKEFMARNTWIFAPQPSMRIATDVVQHVLAHLPQFNAMSVSGYHLQEAGADGVLELALTLANAREYVLRLVDAGADADRVCAQLSFFFAVGPDFFGEIAKLRAARVLWAELARSLGARSARAAQLRMHCQTAGSSLHAQHAHNNIVRTTIEALAAVLGGTQSLHTNAWDEALSLPGEAAATLARDTQRMLQHEMGLCETADPLGGAYMVEALTARTIDAVKARLADVDAQGGVIGAIESGWVQAQLHRAAAQTQARIDSGEQVIVGVNRDRAALPTDSEWLDVDARVVRAVQIERLRQLRASRDAARVRAALDALTHGARTGEGNLLALTIDAMRARASVGECTAALERVWPRWHRALASEAQIYAATRGDDAAWNAARHAVAQWTALQGRAPRMALAKLGLDGHDRGVRVVAGGLADAGFDVRLGPLFTTPQEVAAWAHACDPDIVGVSTLAGAHGALVPTLLDALRAHRCDAPLVLGGIVPEAHREALLAAGVARIVGPDTPLDRIVLDVLRALSPQAQPSPC
ncbi:methylmalonyl-CoA mutase [Paraburkholderia tropica]|uniref:Methylmalonyl-CoA mutase n=1 Tax=Paraburkholderia tropica TaxID=92647 RepID=A0AAQ1GNX2_9BURK|nr:methylmalonyl-CoA mutase [Paraburkholderia tropica]RQN33978.1 methylmalonyl-CoA mutase [Paraburkholderia tropica]SEK14835.1 methylmalonyl-CoA mutase [Paraburkholderia tropica]